MVANRETQVVEQVIPPRVTGQPDPRAPRERMVVRRRRHHHHHRQGRSSREWVAHRSRRRTLRTLFVSAGVLLLMALALYLSLSGRDSSPSPSSRWLPTFVARASA